MNFGQESLYKRFILILISLLFSGFVTASGNEPAICMEFLNNPELYDDCLRRVHKQTEDNSGESCYCDVRKRRQVKARLRRKEELDQQKNNSSPSNAVD